MSSRENYLITSRDIEGIKRDLNFILQRLADRLDKIEGVRGLPDVASALEIVSLTAGRLSIANNDLKIKDATETTIHLFGDGT